MANKNENGSGDVALTKEETVLKNDLIRGRDAILEIFGLSHWKYMKPYLKMPGCPILYVREEGKARGCWLSRRSVLDAWLTKIIEEKPQVGEAA